MLKVCSRLWKATWL